MGVHCFGRFSMIKKLLILLLLLLFRLGFAAGNDSLLTALDKEMAKREVYDAAKINRINQLKQYLAAGGLTTPERYSLNGRLVAEFIPYQFAQAVQYLEHNISLAQKTNNLLFLYKAKLQLAELLSSSGNYAESAAVLAQVNRRQVPDELLDYYYYCHTWLNFRLKFYSAYNATRDAYSQRYHAYADSVMARLPNNGEDYLQIAETRYRDTGENLKSREANLKRLAMAAPGTRAYSRITFFLAQSYLPDDIGQYKKYLILSALSDIQASVKDNASLTALAVQYFKEGDIERAHRYINFAFDDASFYNSRLRLQSISSVLPLINKAYEKAVQKEKAKLQVTVIIISVLALLLLALFFYIYRQVANLRRARKNLQQANEQLNALNGQLQQAHNELKHLYTELTDTNRIKEYYIGNLLNVCSDYLDKLDTYRKTVKKMIMGRQVAELLEKTKSSELIDEELILFYKNFDAIFLQIYPDFVEQLNALLLPEEQITLKNGELLSTELRIFALIRLGITDSAGIARLLRYSVNTIYNYRVKIKNKALSRDDFETQVMKIGAFNNL